MYYAKDFVDEKVGLIAKVGIYQVFWGTTGTLHCIKVSSENKTVRFNILTGKQMVVDSQYVSIPSKILDAIQKVTKTPVNDKTYWTSIIQRINEANNDTPNYKVLNSNECPKLYCVRKPGPKSKLINKNK